MHEDPSNLCVLIKEQEHELSPQQCDALLSLRAGNKVACLSLDEDNRLWYQVSITVATEKAGGTPPLCEIVQRGRGRIPACVITSYFLQVRFV